MEKQNPLAEVAAEVVAGDPVLRKHVRGLVKRLVMEAEHTLDYGTSTDKAALMKAVVPTMLRSIQSADADAGDQAMNEAYQRMLDEMRGGRPAAGAA